MSLTGTRILAIDDTPSIRSFLRLSLECEGAEFHEAASASEGLTKCRDVRPDLIVLDIGLPDKSGLDILHDLKQCGQDAPPHVIVLTVRKGNDMINRAYEEGADAYLTKPFMIDDLLELIAETMPKA